LPSRVTNEVTVGQETHKLVLIARKQHSRTYQLVTSWIGSLARKEPWDHSIRSEHEFEECLNFWCSKALLHDPKTMGPMFERGSQGSPVVQKRGGGVFTPPSSEFTTRLYEKERRLIPVLPHQLLPY
jgi:hypothetical protein